MNSDCYPPRSPASKRRECEKKMQYIMWPSKGSEDSEDSLEDSEMICVQCQERLSSTATCHLERKHPGSILLRRKAVTRPTI